MRNHRAWNQTKQTLKYIFLDVHFFACKSFPFKMLTVLKSRPSFRFAWHGRHISNLTRSLSHGCPIHCFALAGPLLVHLVFSLLVLAVRLHFSVSFDLLHSSLRVSHIVKRSDRSFRLQSSFNVRVTVLTFVLIDLNSVSNCNNRKASSLLAYFRINVEQFGPCGQYVQLADR